MLKDKLERYIILSCFHKAYTEQIKRYKPPFEERDKFVKWHIFVIWDFNGVIKATDTLTDNIRPFAKSVLKMSFKFYRSRSCFSLVPNNFSSRTDFLGFPPYYAKG